MLETIILLITLFSLILTFAVIFALLRLFSIDATLKDIRQLMHQRPAPLQAVDAEHPCPKCKSGPTEIYERSRQGEGWVCRACNHTWVVPT